MNTKLISKRIEPSFFDERKDTIFTWLGMAGVLINTRGTVIFIDALITHTVQNGKKISEDGHPLKIDLPISPDIVKKTDVMLYTHADGDHFRTCTAEILNNKFKPEYLVPPPVKDILLKETAVEENRIIIAKDFAVHKFENTEVTVTPALHDYALPKRWKRGHACGFLVNTMDGTIWHPGDSRPMDELLEIRGVDVLFFDIANAKAHLGPEGSARLARTSGAKLLVAYHYGTYEMEPGSWANCDPDDALPYVKNLSAHFVKPNPGEIFHLPL